MTDYEKMAELFKVFSDATRLKVLKSLLDGEKSVGTIADELSMTQSAVSHQLSTLRMNRLVRVRKEGKMSFYSLDDEHVYEILSCGEKHLCEGNDG